MEEVRTPQPGDKVVITRGPFEKYEGTVESVNVETGKVRVRVVFFGRETPVELEPSQIGKLD